MFERISLVSVTTPFLLPYRRSRLIDMEWGGVALQNTSKGLLYQQWEAYTVGHNVRIRTQTKEMQVFASTEPAIQIGLAFDVNMNYAIAYLHETGELQWKWYDTTILSYTVSTFTGIDSVVCTLDDARPNADTWNDIVLMYTKGGVVYYRLQRDRYTVEYELTALPNRTLWQLGMNTGHRLQARHVHKIGE